MIIRQTLNFAAHLFAGAVFGALAVVAAHRYRKDRRRELPLAEPVPPPPVPPPPAAQI
jgi:hypothetical protein